MTLKTTKLRNAISFALVAGVTTAAGTGTAFAQENNDEQATTLDRIEVTGSRIKRADVEGALPVVVIDRQQIEATGSTTVAEVLRNTTFNSFGSFTPTSGSSAQSFSELSLRGMGGGRTLILIDGRRAPLAPNTGEGQNLNSIPLAAVERIEILSDGASAIYGADALAGVVNIITRRDFTGVQLSGGISRTQRGGDREDGSVMIGAAGDRGRVVAGVSYANNGITYLRDLPWVGPQSSGFGNNYKGVAVNPETGKTLPGSFLPGDAGVPGGCTNENFVRTATRCNYNFQPVMAANASLDTSGLFVRSDYQINDNWRTYFNTSVTRIESFGVYAATPEDIFVSASSPNNTTGADAYISHRFAALGTRDSYVDENVYDVNLGFEVELSDKAFLDFGIRRNESKYYEHGYNYVNKPVARQYFESGEYNVFDPGGNSEEVLNAIRTTVSRDSATTMDELYAIASVDLFEMGGGTSGLAIGAEYREEYYSDIYDQQSAAGNVGGSSGNSSWGERDLTSVFGEWLLPFSSQVEMSLAARHDRYSDFGSFTSPKVSIRYQPIDTLTLRASYGEGVRAPALRVMNQLDAFSADSVTDQQTWEAFGYTSPTSIQINGLRVATPDLEAEESKSWSAGVVWDAANWLNFSLNYYNIEVENRIKFYSAATVVANTANGRYLPAHLGLLRSDVNGAIIEVRAGYGNEGYIETDGFDFSTNTDFDLGTWGNIKNQLMLSYVNNYSVDGGDDQAGTWGAPRWRANLLNTWSKGDFSLTWIVNAMAYSPDYLTEAYEGTYTCQDAMDFGYTNSCSGAEITHDIQGSWKAPWNGRITLGVNNVTGRDPKLDSLYYTEGYDPSLSSPFGRIIYMRYSQSF